MFLEFIKNLIWIWTISFIITILWLNTNEGKNVIKNMFNKDFSELNFDFYKFIVYLSCFIIAPFLGTMLTIILLRGWIRTFLHKTYLRWKLSKLDNKEIKKVLRKKINEIKF